MKIIQKQLVTLLIFWIVVFGVTAYFIYSGSEKIIDYFSSQTAVSIASEIRPEIEAALAGADLNATNLQSIESEIRQILVRDSELYRSVQNLYLVDSQNQVRFALHGQPRAETQTNGIAGPNPGDPQKIVIKKVPGNQVYEAIWQVQNNANVWAVLRLNLVRSQLRAILNNAMIKIYLVGFVGILGVIVISLFSTKSLKSPMKDVEKALDAIDRRKYGHRLKFSKDSEFAKVYNKANLALRRLEQLDSVQRAAVQRRNALLKEMKTISRFLDIMAHEIKNPLHAMGINLDVLKTKVEKKRSKTDILKHADILGQEMEHLQEVVRGLLNYIRPGVPQKQQTKINDIIKSVCESVSAEAGKANVSVETRLSKGLKDVLLDPGQLQQALHNIVVNAIHATGEGGKIQIRTWGKRKKALLSVKDTGVGISKEEQKRIFDLYYTTKKEGTGLGLPITRRLVEANSGQIQLESKVGKGTTVTLLFPTR